MNKSNGSTFFLLWMLLVAVLLVGCEQYATQNKMYGTWEVSAFFSNADIRKLSTEPMPEGVEEELTLQGTHSYHKTGKYNDEREMTLRISLPDTFLTHFDVDT